MLEEKTVLCICCDEEHQTTPEKTSHVNHEGMPVFAVNVKDYTYIIDMYKGQGPGPVCKSHTRDELSTTSEKDLYIDA